MKKAKVISSSEFQAFFFVVSSFSVCKTPEMMCVFKGGGVTLTVHCYCFALWCWADSVYFVKFSQEGIFYIDTGLPKCPHNDTIMDILRAGLDHVYYHYGDWKAITQSVSVSMRLFRSLRKNTDTKLECIENVTRLIDYSTIFFSCTLKCS